ncbi:MAG: hypothetical protein LBT58_03400 [Endomicrobium sp.]|jgi:hypothetical protein|nr:hypothetical protein [Endomicrobium sp.]
MQRKIKLTFIRSFAIALIISAFSIFCFAQDAGAKFSKRRSWIKFGKYKLSINEKLTYAVSWNSVILGDAALEARDLKNIGGRKAYNAFLRVESKPFLSSLFDLNAAFESLV